MGEILNGKEISIRIKEGIKKEVEELKKKGITPTLVSIQVGENAASRIYLKSQARNCSAMGIEYQLKELKEDITSEELSSSIEELNQAREVNGIILQMPLPPSLEAHSLQAKISSVKDVEGINPTNLGWVLYGKPILAPCTPLGIMELLKATGVNLYGKEVVVVGHSDIVGKPLALLLLNEFATTTVCHIATGERGALPEHIKRAEILVVAVGKANLVKGEWIKEGAIVIDVGINRVEGKIVGDVEFESAKERASYITPVPGGVGPLTVTMLLKNTVKAAKLQKGDN